MWPRSAAGNDERTPELWCRPGVLSRQVHDHLHSLCCSSAGWVHIIVFGLFFIEFSNVDNTYKGVSTTQEKYLMCFFYIASTSEEDTVESKRV